MAKRRTTSQRSELIFDIHNFNINADTRELFLQPSYDVENEEAEIDHRMATTLIKNMRFLDSQDDKPIIIHMCSCGGSWEYGLAIYDVISMSKSVVYLIAYGYASSMSSIVLQAADCRIMSKNAYFMLHDGYDFWDGTSKGLVTHAEEASKATEKMINIYLEKCRQGPYFKQKDMTDARIKKFIRNKIDSKQEWYLSPNEAIEHGFADYILEDNYQNIEEMINPE